VNELQKQIVSLNRQKDEKRYFSPKFETFSSDVIIINEKMFSNEMQKLFIDQNEEINWIIVSQTEPHWGAHLFSNDLFRAIQLENLTKRKLNRKTEERLAVGYRVYANEDLAIAKDFELVENELDDTCDTQG